MLSKILFTLTLFSKLHAYAQEAGIGADDNTFWEEFELALKKNDLPDYLQTGLEHATFEKLDADNDGILSVEELHRFQQILVGSSIKAIFGDAEEFSANDVKSMSRYPVLRIKDGMTEEQKAQVCTAAAVFSDMDVDDILSSIVDASESNGRRVLDDGSDFVIPTASLGEAFLDDLETLESGNELQFSDWKNLIEKPESYLPAEWSSQPFVPEECLEIDFPRRRLQGKIHFAILMGSMIAAASEVIFVECHENGHMFWDFHAPKDGNCNWQRFANIATGAFVAAEGTYWLFKSLGVTTESLVVGEELTLVAIEETVEVVEGETIGAASEGAIEDRFGERVLFELGLDGLIPASMLAKTGVAQVSDIWEPISLNAACETNNDRQAHIRRNWGSYGFNLESCKSRCENTQGCQGIDFYRSSGWCNLYNHPCKYPTAAHDGSSSWKRVLVRTSRWMQWDNYCVSSANRDLHQTNKPEYTTKQACHNACRSDNSCSAYEWYNSGWGGSKCKLILTPIRATKGAKGGRWQDAECHVKPTVMFSNIWVQKMFERVPLIGHPLAQLTDAFRPITSLLG